MSRIEEVPVYQQREDEVSAKLYNLWRRAKLHFPLPIDIELPGLSGMKMMLEEHEWVCVDGRQNYLPVLAWVEFEDLGRDALHTPVKCKLNYYHFAASRIRAKSLELMEQILDERLKEEA